MPVRSMSHAIHLRHLVLLAAAAFTTALITDTAVAQDLDPKAKECVDAYHASQELRLDQKIRAARDKATVCAQEACPNAVRAGCTKWLTELAENQPSLAITARGPDGADVTDVVVEVDGTKVADSLTGRPIELDPGKHQLRFKHRDLVSTQEVLVTEGIKNRPVEVRFGAATTESPAAPAEEQRGAPVAAFVIGGIGLVSLGVFAGLAAAGRGEVDDLRDTCAPGCATEDVDSAKTKILLGDVFLATGAVAVGVSAVWLIVHYSKSSKPAASTGSVRWSVGPTAHGAFGSLAVSH